jgi:hypothetical protein
VALLYAGVIIVMSFVSDRCPKEITTPAAITSSSRSMLRPGTQGIGGKCDTEASAL